MREDYNGPGFFFPVFFNFVYSSLILDIFFHTSFMYHHVK